MISINDYLPPFEGHQYQPCRHLELPSPVTPPEVRRRNTRPPTVSHLQYSATKAY